MARPIWNGVLSFGLLNVPIAVMSGERKVDLHFRMLDGRDKKPVRYERVNAETGEEVPWKSIVKAFEYEKGSYVVLEPEDIESAAPESHESIDIEAFVEADKIIPAYYEKPYVLVPGKKAEKGYVLLRETLRKTGRVGIGRVVIRTRQYLCAVFPQDDALVMNLLRYPQEIVDIDEYKLPAAQPSGAKISKAEFEMAEKLIESMASSWNPEDYKDEFRDRLRKVIEQRVKSEGVTAAHQDRVELPEDATTNVVDFMSLLRKSLATNKRTAAKPKPRATSKATGTKPKNNKTAKESTAKKTPSSGKKSKARKSA